MRFETFYNRLKRTNQSETLSAQSSCALVGNAGILLDSQCGHVIDKFPFVIRMNLALYGGIYSSDVGSKVNLITLNAFQMDELIACTKFISDDVLEKSQLNVCHCICLKNKHWQS